MCWGVTGWLARAHNFRQRVGNHINQEAVFEKEAATEKNPGAEGTVKRKPYIQCLVGNLLPFVCLNTNFYFMDWCCYWVFLLLFILFIFGCIGSLLLHAGFL